MVASFQSFASGTTNRRRRRQLDLFDLPDLRLCVCRPRRRLCREFVAVVDKGRGGRATGRERFSPESPLQGCLSEAILWIEDEGSIDLL